MKVGDRKLGIDFFLQLVIQENCQGKLFIATFQLLILYIFVNKLEIKILLIFMKISELKFSPMYCVCVFYYLINND